MTTFTELVYDYDAREFVQEKFPDAKIRVQQNMIHPQRFEVTLPLDQQDRFYVLMILEGWISVCFAFRLKMISDKQSDNDEVLRWHAMAEASKSVGYKG